MDHEKLGTATVIHDLACLVPQLADINYGLSMVLRK